MKHFIVAALILCSVTSFGQDKKQCAGTTTKKEQCKNMTANTYCTMHDPATPRCGAKTSKGTPCKTIVKAGEKCWRHKG